MQRKSFAQRPRRVALFVTCLVDMFYPDVGMATVDLLEAQGVEVIFPMEQTCCGQPAFNAGFRDEARTMARHFLDVFAPLVVNGEVDAIVAPSGSCTTMVNHFYTVLFEEPQFARERARAEAVAAVSFELTEFLVDVLGVSSAAEAGAMPPAQPVRAAYHACCHLQRELGVDAQPRLLLGSLPGVEVVEMQGAEECCGFGGLFAIKNAPISEAMGRTKTLNIQGSGADVVALCDVSCMMHINGLLSRQGQQVRAVHLAQLLTGEYSVAQTAAPETPTGSAESGASAGGSGTASSGVAPSEKAAPPRRWQDVK